MKHITVEIKDVYGARVVYPICEDAKVFARIAGTKTLTNLTMTCIEELGYMIKVQQREIWNDNHRTQS